MGGVASKIKKLSFLLQCKMWEKSWAARLDKPEQFVIVPAFQLGMCPNILSLENRQKCGKRGWNFHVVIKKYLTHFFFFRAWKFKSNYHNFFQCVHYDMKITGRGINDNLTKKKRKLWMEEATKSVMIINHQCISFVVTFYTGWLSKQNVSIIEQLSCTGALDR